MEKDEMESMLRELIKYEENNDYFFLTRRERREFQDYVERLMEIGETPPHGRLIDADKFKYDECGICDGCCEAFNGNECSMCHKECRCEFMKDIDEAPTVIEAEEEKE